jgi:hypothetical protein
MSGVATGEAALVCTGAGYLPWQSDLGVVVLVKCYFSHDAESITTLTISKSFACMDVLNVWHA